jgi:phenylacetate-CoA ligase
MPDTEHLPEVPEVPYFWRSLDWKRLVDDYPPPPLFETGVGALSPEALYQLQDRRFVARLREAWEFPFYQRRWHEAGLEPGDVASLADIERIPPFTSSDLREAMEADPPFGGLGARSAKGGLWKIQIAGTATGENRATQLDPMGWEILGIQAARSLFAAGARPGQVIQIPMTDALPVAGWTAYVATLEWLGCVPVTSGSDSVTPAEVQLEHAREFGTNGWFSDVKYLGQLAEAASEMSFDLRELPTVFLQASLSAEELGGLARADIEASWGAPLYDRYATQELGLIAFECERQAGLHVSGDTAYVELVDSSTGNRVPSGEIGSVVATSLFRSVPPIIRYDHGDLFRSRPNQECDCGLRTEKLERAVSHVTPREDA